MKLSFAAIFVKEKVNRQNAGSSAIIAEDRVALAGDYYFVNSTVLSQEQQRHYFDRVKKEFDLGKQGVEKRRARVDACMLTP